ncbi:MAG: hypothetical protein GX950_03455 [Candidatus Diapherotrites archaeon]|uniref:Uncharacterized protein n=1 Tax=Candidatus Iainarchaeum sp. TaxID=3101447 RepID=A0A7K4C020_9ARCH|nr:hypothetical protein [Candidatus Diapherotrites archaeon]
MINSKGQAFSVFELLIAAIVAVTILFVLLPIIGGIIMPSGKALDEISKTITSNSNGLQTTQAFTFEPRETIRASMLASKGGIDECAIFFDTSKFEGGSGNKLVAQVNMDTPDGGMSCTSKVINQINSPVRAKATIICAVSPAELGAMIKDAQFNEIEVPWGEDSFANDYSKVCVVILRNA